MLPEELADEEEAATLYRYSPKDIEDVPEVLEHAGWMNAVVHRAPEIIVGYGKRRLLRTVMHALLEYRRVFPDVAFCDSDTKTLLDAEVRIALVVNRMELRVCRCFLYRVENDQFEDLKVDKDLFAKLALKLDETDDDDKIMPPVFGDGPAKKNALLVFRELYFCMAALTVTGDLGCYVRRQEMIDIVEEEVRESLGETVF